MVIGKVNNIKVMKKPVFFREYNLVHYILLLMWLLLLYINIY